MYGNALVGTEHMGVQQAEYDRVSVSLPIRVGLVGTGYAARLRSETLKADGRSQLIAVSGHTPEKTAEFSQSFGAEPLSSWQELVHRPDIDLVVIATVNRDHGAIARAALQAGKHVIVEYPLALDVIEAEELIALATAQSKLLHVEHIELLSGIHLAVRDSLPAVGNAFYVRYSNINPQHPAPQKWTYQTDLFGFPLIGAVSRIHRLIDLFGPVKTVGCQARFWPNSVSTNLYTSCLCTAHLRFVNGLIAEVVYGKGEAFWQAERILLVQGETGALMIDGEQGTLIQQGKTRSLDLGSRRGLFAKDTTMVLDHLTTGAPLYISPTASLYALQVADAARQSAETGQTVQM
jgi:biliverdin reductase